jgi:hypothetical protein
MSVVKSSTVLRARLGRWEALGRWMGRVVHLELLEMVCLAVRGILMLIVGGRRVLVGERLASRSSHVVELCSVVPGGLCCFASRWDFVGEILWAGAVSLVFWKAEVKSEIAHHNQSQSLGDIHFNGYGWEIRMEIRMGITT